MAGRRRTELASEAERRNFDQLAALGADVRAARRRRSLTQKALGAKAGVSRMSVSRLERGHGGGLTLDAWQRIGLAVGRPLVAKLQRAVQEEPVDAGHLAIQELVLRLGRAAGYRGLVELPTKPNEAWRSIDVALVDDARRRFVVIECWNTFGDIGGAARTSARKAAEAEALATARWGEALHSVGLLWVVRATARNRALVARYPELFAARFPGSSALWVRALATGGNPRTELPSEPALAWCNVSATRIFAWRRPTESPPR